MHTVKADIAPRGKEPEVFALYTRKKTGRLIPCPGEAHSNPMIDGCSTCAPAWGEIEELAPVDVAEAERLCLAVKAGDLSDEQKKALALAGWREVWVSQRLRWGSLSFLVLVPPGVGRS